MVSADTITNPLGAVVIFDGDSPRIFTAKAREVVSGGALVMTSGATGDFSSGTAGYADGDIQVSSAQDPTLFNGVALNNAGSNELVSIATRGTFIMRAAGIVSGGAWVGHNGSGNVTNWVSSVSGTALLDNAVVGRAMSDCASGTNAFVLVGLLA
jgi:hypothetical protein